MKKLLLSLFIVTSANVFSQSLESFAVMLEATPQKSPAAILLKWKKDPAATSYSVFRKAPDDLSWGNSIAQPAPGDSAYTDTTVVAGQEYEYRIVKLNGGTAGPKNGYAISGIDIPAKEDRGMLLLLVDSVVQSRLMAEVTQLEWDLIGDGWELEKLVISPLETVAAVKQKIVVVNQLHPNRLKSVFLLGRIPVPYSGSLNPDAHPDHLGAWPADAYYGDMNEIDWTDNLVTEESASRVANRNTPGDGKMDQSLIPTLLELAVGRVDLYDMPAFNADYVELIKAYLQKNHEYRHKAFEVRMRAVVDNNFDPVQYSEVFAGSGMRSFSSLVGADSIVQADYLNTLKEPGGAILSYGTGAGSYTSAGGIGTSNNFIDSSINTIFSMTFGSYFGDWDNTNNFLRAPLASPGKGLTNIWAGRPHCTIHHLGGGYTIGQSFLKNANNYSTYLAGYMGQGVHFALMGDPTLRFHRIAPPTSVVKNVGTRPDGNPNISLSWTAPAEPADGYYVYHSANRNGPYFRVSDSIITTTAFTHQAPVNGDNFYQVKAVKWNNVPSRYLNTSQAAFDSINVFVNSVKPVREFKLRVFPVPSQGSFFVETDRVMQKITLTDINGRLVQEWNNPQESSLPKMDLNPELSNGIYFIHVYCEEQVIPGKLVILR